MPSSSLWNSSRRGFLAGVVAVVFGARAFTAPRIAAATITEWKSLPSNGPAARWDHGLAGNERDIELILFGGRDAAGLPLGDTWIYDVRDRVWTMVDTPGPSPRFGSAISTAPDGDHLLLFGGQSDAAFFNDTWAFGFEDRTWTLLDAGDAGPAPRYGLAGAFDGDGRFTIAHGFTFDGRYDDTWAFDGVSSSWVDRTPLSGAPRPLNRCLHEFVWDAPSERFVLFGGCSSGFGPCPQGDTWLFDPVAGRWVEVSPAVSPAARTNPAMLHDDRHGGVLLFGGSTADGYVADAWRGALEDEIFGWTQMEISGDAPSPRASHDMAMVRGDVHVFGGVGAGGVSADLWKLSMTE